MKHMSRAHAVLFVMAWLVAFLLGPVSVLPVMAGLLVVELLVWRLDLLQLPRSRRPGRVMRSRTATTLERQFPSYGDVCHAVALGVHSGREFDLGLRRRLQRIASSRLSDHYGIDLARDRERAAELLGTDAWRLLDPRRPISAHAGLGVDRAVLTRIVDRLERL
jgi:hypothetical protein